MAKKIRRQIEIGGAKRWISGDSEQEYADNLARALTGSAEPRLAERKHNFRAYAQKWFEVFSKPNVAAVTAITYERQLKNHIYPVLGKIDVEDILPADVQRVFNEMDGAKETKIKVKNVLNMVLEQALEDDLIRRNPLHSRSIRITGRASEATEPYTIEQMRFLVGRICSVER